jgi:hypothetical protein
MHEPSWFSPLFSYGTLVVEGLAPIFVLTPIFQRFTRSIHIAAVWSLHIGIALTVSVGPFSYAMLGLNFLIMPPMVIDRVAAWLERGKLDRTFAYRGDLPMVHAFARILARLDTFEKIRFVDLRDGSDGPSEPGVELSCSTGGDSTTWVSGHSAIVEAARGLPAARLWGVLFAIPLFPWILKVVLNSKASSSHSRSRPRQRQAPAALRSPHTFTLRCSIASCSPSGLVAKRSHPCSFSQW